MKLAAFNAVCPFEIGDKIGMRKNACAVGGRTLDVIVERTITDIVCMHSVKADPLSSGRTTKGGLDGENHINYQPKRRRCKDADR